jgi:hypothetical protein
LAASAYLILQTLIVTAQGGSESKLAAAIGKDWKGKLSAVLYIAAIIVSFFQPWAAGVIYIFVALTWLIPDRRLERLIFESERG